MPTRALKLNHGRTGYYTAWIDEQGKRHLRRFGTNRADAEDAFTVFHHQWASDPFTRTPGMAAFPTVGEALADYYAWADDHYRDATGDPTGHARNLRNATRELAALYSDVRLHELGPRHIKAVQKAMADCGLSLGVINQRVGQVRHFIGWCVAGETCPASVLVAIRCVPPLKAGRHRGVRETDGVGTVPADVIEATKARFRHPVIPAMIDFALLTGARPGEVCRLTWGQVERDGDVWLYRPTRHKTAHTGRGRVIAIGPRAQAVLAPFLSRMPDVPAFSPREAIEVGEGRKAAERVGMRYTPSAWLSAVRKACMGVGEVTVMRGGRRYTAVKRWKHGEDPPAGAKVIHEPLPHWHPNQLRHNCATMVRARYGVEAAQHVLGHAKADVTQVYAERDEQKAVEVMAAVG